MFYTHQWRHARCIFFQHVDSCFVRHAASCNIINAAPQPPYWRWKGITVHTAMLAEEKQGDIALQEMATHFTGDKAML